MNDKPIKKTSWGAGNESHSFFWQAWTIKLQLFMAWESRPLFCVIEETLLKLIILSRCQWRIDGYQRFNLHTCLWFLMPRACVQETVWKIPWHYKYSVNKIGKFLSGRPASFSITLVPVSQNLFAPVVRNVKLSKKRHQMLIYVLLWGGQRTVSRLSINSGHTVLR